MTQQRNAWHFAKLIKMVNSYRHVKIASTDRFWYDYIEELKKLEREKTPVKCRHGLHTFSKEVEEFETSVAPSSAMKRALKDTGRRTEDLDETFKVGKYRWTCINCGHKTPIMSKIEFRLEYPEVEWE